MARLSSLKLSPNSLHIFSTKTPSSFSSLSSMKIKNLFKTFMFSHIYPISRAFDKAKSFLLKFAKNVRFVHLLQIPILKKKNKNNNKQKKLFFGSFSLHYNWCSSHVMPLGQESYNNASADVYYDSCWNSVIPTSFGYKYRDQKMHECDDDELSRYLQWLEEDGNNNNNSNNNQECSSCNEIDKLADLFIANCHEKFRLEKQESYRKFQEMLARSV